VLFPGFHVNTPPGIFDVAVTLAVCPKQMAVFETVIAGLGFTRIVPDEGALGHCKLLVKTTVYVVVCCGASCMVAVVNPPGFQVKVPLGREEVAVIEPVCPIQMVSLFTLTVGVGFTVTVPEAVGLTQPAEEVYMTV
jgi:hypothetical protein